MDERHLSRTVIECKDGKTVRHTLSVVTLSRTGYSIKPFDGESAHTRYHDGPIKVSTGADGIPRISEAPDSALL